MTMRRTHAIRRTLAMLIAILFFWVISLNNPELYETIPSVNETSQHTGLNALDALANLPVKGRAPKTGYTREQFGGGWDTALGCDTRNVILRRDLKATVINDECKVVSGILEDPYTGKTIQFTRGNGLSQAVQIDHVVALSDAWQKGAQQLDFDERVKFANDPLVLLAVDGSANQEKGDGDAATWLPPNKSFRCEYVARQIAIKTKYRLWVTEPEKTAIERTLKSCQGQRLPVEK